MQRREATQRLAALFAATALTGCAALPQLNPLRMDIFFDDNSPCATQAPVLLIFLPGAHMTPEEMVREGFLAAVRQRGLAVDVQIADAHLGYVYDGSMGRRFREDVVLPALARGYRRIWLVGISLGGFVALSYARQYPSEIEGLVALAPYLGTRPFLSTITQAGGPTAWRQTAQASSATDIDHALWFWLTDLQPSSPRLYLGYGRDDRFAAAHEMLASVLPAAQVHVVPGGHDWGPWKSLWAHWLDRKLLPSRCIA